MRILILISGLVFLIRLPTASPSQAASRGMQTFKGKMPCYVCSWNWNKDKRQPQAGWGSKQCYTSPTKEMVRSCPVGKVCGATIKKMSNLYLVDRDCMNAFDRPESWSSKIRCDGPTFCDVTCRCIGACCNAKRKCYCHFGDPCYVDIMNPEESTSDKGCPNDENGGAPIIPHDANATINMNGSSAFGDPDNFFDKSGAIRVTSGGILAIIIYMF